MNPFKVNRKFLPVSRFIESPNLLPSVMKIKWNKAWACDEFPRWRWLFTRITRVTSKFQAWSLLKIFHVFSWILRWSRLKVYDESFHFTSLTNPAKHQNTIHSHLSRLLRRVFFFSLRLPLFPNAMWISFKSVEEIYNFKWLTFTQSKPLTKPKPILIYDKLKACIENSSSQNFHIFTPQPSAERKNHHRSLMQARQHLSKSKDWILMSIRNVPEVARGSSSRKFSARFISNTSEKKYRKSSLKKSNLRTRKYKKKIRTKRESESQKKSFLPSRFCSFCT